MTVFYQTGVFICNVLASRQVVRKLLFSLVFFAGFSSHLCASDPKVDSLKALLRTEKNSAKWPRLYNNLGNRYFELGQFDTARKVLGIGLKLALEKKDSASLPRIYMNTGNSYMQQGNYTNALDQFLKAIAIREAKKDSQNLPNAYNSIGIVYFRLNDYPKALDYWYKCVSLNTRQKREDRLVTNYSNLAMLYGTKGDLDKSLQFMMRSLEMAEEQKDEATIPVVSGNIGQLYLQMKNYPKALEYLERSRKRGGDQENGGIGSPEILGSIAGTYKEMGQFKQAHIYYDKAIHAGQELKNIDILRQLYKGMAELYEAEGKMEKAYEYHKLFSRFTDSIFNKQNMEKISDLKATFQVEKKEKELKEAEKVAGLKRDAEAHHQKLIQYTLLFGFFMISLLALVIYRGYSLKKKSNEVILSQNGEIAEKNDILALVNKELTDSINYAKRIQEAILPPLSSIQKALPQSFVFYQPRNVVSGDFYFLQEGKKDELILAVCDCTGHGVPGAFMSVIGTEQLGKIIHEKGVTTPSLILDALHQGLRQALQQDVNETRDGMDAVLCKINKSTRQLEYAGANRPLWILPKGGDKLVEVKANKQPVGGLEGEHRTPFTNQVINLAEGDRVYLSTDGYADQFGGEKGKKFMVRNFQNLLLGLNALSMKDQEAVLRTRFVEWKGLIEQVDDILVIGFEL